MEVSNNSDVNFEGTVINVSIEKEAGRLDILVENAEGEKLYKGDNVSTGEFSLEIPETGTYKFLVTGSKAKGSVSFIVAE